MPAFVPFTANNKPVPLGTSSLQVYVVLLIVKLAGVFSVPSVAAVTLDADVPSGTLTKAKFTVSPSVPSVATTNCCDTVIV